MFAGLMHAVLNGSEKMGEDAARLFLSSRKVCSESHFRNTSILSQVLFVPFLLRFSMRGQAPIHVLALCHQRRLWRMLSDFEATRRGVTL